MNIAFIGHEERKFTPRTQEAAIQEMQRILRVTEQPTIVSGRCHLGGIDIWAEELADRLSIPKVIYPAVVHQWDGGGQDGYKQRNIKIAFKADVVVVLVVATLPPGYPPDKWNRGPCYHCAKRASDVGRPRHVKSGACWTAWYAVEELHKEAHWIDL